MCRRAAVAREILTPTERVPARAMCDTSGKELRRSAERQPESPRSPGPARGSAAAKTRPARFRARRRPYGARRSSKTARAHMRADLHRQLRTSRAMSRPRGSVGVGVANLTDVISTGERPAEADDRALPGHSKSVKFGGRPATSPRMTGASPAWARTCAAPQEATSAAESA